MPKILIVLVIGHKERKYTLLIAVHGNNYKKITQKGSTN